MCISWKLKCWILLMHGVTMKFLSSLSEFRFSDLNTMMFGICEFLANRFGKDIFPHWGQSNYIYVYRETAWYFESSRHVCNLCAASWSTLSIFFLGCFSSLTSFPHIIAPRWHLCSHVLSFVQLCVQKDQWNIQHVSRKSLIKSDTRWN